MRINVITIERMKRSFSNLGILKKQEDLIVFPMHEFTDLYEESKRD